MFVISTMRRKGLASVLLSLGVAALFLFTVADTFSAGVPADHIRGWVWNGYRMPAPSTSKIGLGWVSMSCLNDFNNDGKLDNQCIIGSPAKSYGLFVSDGGDGLGGNTDYLQGCMWSSAYGWICFNGGGGNTYQCDQLVATNPATDAQACQDLSVNGIPLQATMGHCSISWEACTQNNQCPDIDGQAQTCKAYFHYLTSPAYNGGAWEPTPASDRRATILSLWTNAEKEKAYITFPQAQGVASSTDPAEQLYGCFDCDPVTKRCGACLNVSTETETSDSPNPNLLCWNCGRDVGKCSTTKSTSCTQDANCPVGEKCIVGCTVNDSGSCKDNRDKNSCMAASCSACTAFTGVVVNKNPQGQYEMCGWGYHGYGATGGTAAYYTNLDSGAVIAGRQSDVAVDAKGRPAMSDFSSAGVGTIFSLGRCGDPACRIRRIAYSDSNASGNIAQVGRTSIDIGPDNIPRAVYERGTELRLASCSDPSCALVSSRTVAIAGAGNVLREAAISVAPDNNAVISYFETNAGTLKVFKCANANCIVGDTATLAGPNASAPYNDVDIVEDTTAGKAIVVYADTAAGDIYLKKCADGPCSSFTTQQVKDAAVGQVGAVSVAVSPPTAANSPYTVFIVSTNPATNGISIINCGLGTAGTPCAAPIEKSIATDAANAVSLDTDTNGFAIVSYVSTDNKLHVVRCNDLNCASFSNVAIAPSNQSVTNQSAVSMSKDNNPFVTYYDDTGDDLRGMKCNTRTCDVVNRRGFGWLAFSPKPVGDITYVEGRGNIFSGANIESPVGPPATKYNSAYIIEASGDIRNWFSERQYAYSNRSIAPPYLQQSSNQADVYANFLGKLDYKGIVTDVTTGKPVDNTQTTGKNKFGATIVYQSGGQLPAAPDSLNNRVLYWSPASGKLVLNTANAINCETGKSGAGILVIDGDLEIKNDITYGASCSAGISKLREVGSAVWIVRGDVDIDPSVTQVAGAFVVLGRTNVAKCPPLTSNGGHCGRFSTGSNTTQLTVNGPVLARQFNFERRYAASGGPAELFIADGRLQANTPSGLYDFARSLPRFSKGF